jgi:hypothetical protein
MHPGQGPGLSLHDLGETGGSETVTLLHSEMPSHSHNLTAATPPATLFAGSAPTSLARVPDRPSPVSAAPRHRQPASRSRRRDGLQNHRSEGLPSLAKRSCDDPLDSTMALTERHRAAMEVSENCPAGRHPPGTIFGHDVRIFLG